MKRLLIALPLLLLPAACGSDDTADATTSSAAVAAVAVVDAAEGQALIESLGERLTVIDVRTPAEFAEGHVPGAVNAAVESGAFGAYIADLPKDAPYLVYCRSGRRSAIAAQAMIDAGFTDVTDMGAITDWAAAGFPVEV